MRYLAAFLLFLGFLGGCANMRAQEIEAAWKQVESIGTECIEKRRRGELSGFVAGHECASSRTRFELFAAGYPYMDLIDLWLAYDLAVSRRIDAGEMTEADANLQLAELMSRINTEAMRRDLAYQQATAQRLAAWGSFMQGLGAMQQSLQPQYSQPQYRPIHCFTAGNTITCH